MTVLRTAPSTYDPEISQSHPPASTELGPQVLEPRPLGPQLLEPRPLGPQLLGPQPLGPQLPEPQRPGWWGRKAADRTRRGLRLATPDTERVRPRAGRELLLVTVLFLAYKLGRIVVIGHLTAAFTNAGLVWRCERAMRLPDELSVQRVILHQDLLVHLANIFYAGVHFPATAIFLLWVYLRRPTYYRWARRSLVGLTAAGFCVQVIMPLAPPRMLHLTGLIDTGRLFGPTVYGSPDTDTLSNQYAAMPSLHVGWALMIAIGIIATTRTRWRYLMLLHPVATLVVVVATANHYWLDAIVATALLVLVLMILAAWDARTRQRPTSPASAPPRVTARSTRPAQ